MKGCLGAERGDGFSLDFLDQAECRWSEAAVAVNDEGDERAAQGDAMGAVLTLFVALSLGHGFAGGKVDVVSGMRVDAGEVKQDGASGHKDFTVWKEVGEVLLDDVSQAVVAPGELAKDVAGVVMAARNNGAFELGTAQAVPWVHPEIDTFLAKKNVWGMSSMGVHPILRRNAKDVHRSE